MVLLARALVAWLAVSAAVAQVHYFADGRPWRQRAHSGPDQVVDGWFYNLGVSGLRVELAAGPQEPVQHLRGARPGEGEFSECTTLCCGSLANSIANFLYYCMTIHGAVVLSIPLPLLLSNCCEALEISQVGNL